MDVNLERAEDVLTHKRLLHLARDPANRPAFDVRLVQVSLSLWDLHHGLFHVLFLIILFHSIGRVLASFALMIFQDSEFCYHKTGSM